MAVFRYTGPYTRAYPEIMMPDGCLVADTGDELELAEAPDDGYWVEVTAANGGKPARRRSGETSAETADDVKEA